MPRARIFEIVQYEKNPITNEDLNFGIENIKSGLNHKSIKKWAYICHNRDPYTEEEEIKSNGLYKAGTPRPDHWHVVCQCDNAIDLQIVANWFGVPENQIEIKKGRRAFLDCCVYFTHEDEKQQEKGKALYRDEEIFSNVDWRAEYMRAIELKLKYGKSNISEKDIMRYEVLMNGKTLRECMDENPLVYADDEAKLKKLRLDYLAKRSEMPSMRLNYYIEGGGGMGKDTLSKILAKQFFPNLEYDDDVYFQVGQSGALFEGYDGQPVIIWSDKRAAALLKELGGRGNVFNVFDTHPSKVRQNVKFSSACLVNSINIVNGVEPYEDFLDGLAGEYIDRTGTEYKAEDKNQSYRRFPMIICLREDDFDILINKGFAEQTFEYQTYFAYKHISGNFGKILQRLDKKLGEPILIDMTSKIVEEHQKLEDTSKINLITDEALIPEEFKEYGKKDNHLYKWKIKTKAYNDFTHEWKCGEYEFEATKDKKEEEVERIKRTLWNGWKEFEVYEEEKERLD